MKILKESVASKFNNIIVETNFVTSMYNPEDNHRVTFEEIVKIAKKLYVPIIAYKESAKSFTTKLSIIHTHLIEYYLNLDFKKDNSEIYEEEEKLLENLNSLFRHNANFNRYLINVARNIRLNCFNNMDFILELNDHILKIGNIGVFRKNIDSRILSINQNLELGEVPLPKLKKRSSETKYNSVKRVTDMLDYDKPDKKLFMHIMYHYPELYECPVSFISSDQDFMKKSNSSLTELNTQNGLDISQIQTIYIYDYFDKPAN